MAAQKGGRMSERAILKIFSGLSFNWLFFSKQYYVCYMLHLRIQRILLNENKTESSEYTQKGNFKRYRDETLQNIYKLTILKIHQQSPQITQKQTLRKTQIKIFTKYKNRKFRIPDKAFRAQSNKKSREHTNKETFTKHRFA